MPRPNCFQHENKQHSRSELLSEFVPFPKLCWLQFFRNFFEEEQNGVGQNDRYATLYYIVFTG